jgi:hypothetical protein
MIIENVPAVKPRPTPNPYPLPDPRPLDEADAVNRLLTGPQHTALRALGAGQTVVAAADSAGVTRNTVTRWIRSCPEFRAAFNAWQQALIESTQARLLRSAEAAAAVVDQAIQAGDAKLALNLLKHMQLGRAAITPGPTDLILAKDEIAVIRDEELQQLHDRALHADRRWISPRERESREASAREWERRKREEAAKAGRVERPA